MTEPPWSDEVAPDRHRRVEHRRAVVVARAPPASGTYGPNVPPWPTAIGGAVSPVGYGSITRTFSSGSLLSDLGVSVYVTVPGSEVRNVLSTDLPSVRSSAWTTTSALASSARDTCAARVLARERRVVRERLLRRRAGAARDRAGPWR